MLRFTGVRRTDKKLARARGYAIFLAVTAIVFICLYFYQTQENQRRYEEVYSGSLRNAVDLIDQTIKDDFDYDTKYREITAEMNVVCRMVYLAEADTENQKTINQVYYAFVKLPNQVKGSLKDIKTGLNSIIEGKESEGYKQLQTIVTHFDKLDY